MMKTFFLFLMKFLIPKYDREPLLADLKYRAAEVEKNKGSFQATIWLLGQVARSLPGFFSAGVYWRMSLIQSYVKIAFRNMKKQKIYSFINIAGLSIGMACCILILLYVKDELSYDRFHQNADSVYRVTTYEELGDHHYGGAAFGAMRVCADEIPEVQGLARIFRRDGLFTVDEEKFEVADIFIADSTFFRIFSYAFVAGEGAKAMDTPRSVIITQSLADRFFGNEDPIGKTVQLYGEGELRVMGVVEDIPSRSHFHFNAVVTNVGRENSRSWQSWFGIIGWAYLHVQDGGFDPQEIEERLLGVFDRHMGDHARAIGLMPEFRLQKLTDIHLRSHLEFEIEENGDVRVVVTLTVIAIFVLLIACLNFINLSTARYSSRGREVGMRKVLGANRARLVTQFLGESLTYSSLAMVLAFLIVGCVIPFFNAFSGKTLHIGALFSGTTWPWLVLLLLITGLGSGAYPSFFLSGFKPAVVLHGNMMKGKFRSILRKALVIFQFCISIMLIACTLVVINQLNYMKQAQLGFDEGVFVVQVPIGVLLEDHDVFKERLKSHPGILRVSYANDYPGRTMHVLRFGYEGKAEKEAVQVQVIRSDHDFAVTYGFEFVDGRDFSVQMTSDSGVYLINQTAARLFNWEEEAIGKQIWHNPSDKDVIVGIIKDFHYKSFRDMINPLVIRCVPGIGNEWSKKFIAVKLRPEGTSETIGFIKKTWKQFNEGYGFHGFFIDEKFDSLYASEEQLSLIATVFAAIAIVIACLGLLGLINFSVAQRTKEIGIRKSLGATAGSIILLLSREYTTLVLAANILALPAAYLMMKHLWLINFAYRIDPQLSVFAAAGMASFLMAFISVSVQSFKAGLAKPVEALRYE